MLIWLTPYRIALIAIAMLLGGLNAAAFIGGIWHPKLDWIANFAPFLLVSGFVLLVLAARVRSPVLAILVLLIAPLPPALVIGADALGDVRGTPAEPASHIKVMTFNLWSQNRDLERFEALIQKERPDILFLQEASSKRYRELLGRLAKIYRTHVSNDPLNCATHVFAMFPLVTKVEHFECDLVIATLSVPGSKGPEELKVASVHLSRDKFWQEAVLATVMKDWHTSSAIIGGDFNRTPWSASLRKFDQITNFRRRTNALPTWPSPHYLLKDSIALPAPVLPIDHVFATQDWQTVNVRKGPAAGSDHYPVIVELARSRSDVAR